MPFSPLFSPFVSLPNSLDSKRSHTYLVLSSAMRCLYSIMLPVMGFMMSLMHSLVSVSDKGYTLLMLGIYIVLTSSLTMIACNSSALICVGYLFVLVCRFQRSVWIGGLISSHTSSTLVASTAFQDSTLGGGSLALGIFAVLGYPMLLEIGSIG